MNLAGVVASHAQRIGDKVAIIMGGRSLTYRQLADEGQAVASGLAALSVKPGDRIIMFAENVPEHFVVYQAAARLGAVFTPVHTSFKTRELGYAIANASPKIILTDPALLDLVRAAAEAAGQTPVFVLMSGTADGVRRYDELQLAGSALAPVDLPPDHPALISYTSGTTSMPKPVKRSHGAEIWSAERYREAWGFDESDRVLVVMSLGWVFGLCSLSQTAFAAGATVILERQFSPTATLTAFDRERITAFAGTMSMYAILLNVLRDRDFDTSSLRKLFLGGEPRNEAIVDEIEGRLGLRLCEGWALTETFPVLAVHPVRDRDAPRAVLGRLVEGVKLRLVDENGRDVAPGETGEAWISSPGSFLDYNGEPDLTVGRMSSDGWIRSGDLLRLDGQGYYTFVARLGDLIIRGGTNISPSEVESAICTYPGIADAVVVGLPDATLGEVVVALFSTNIGEAPEIEAMRNFLHEHMAKYKVPTWMFHVSEMPSGTTGKKNRPAAKVWAAALIKNQLASA